MSAPLDSIANQFAQLSVESAAQPSAIVSVDDVTNKFFDYVICGGGTAGLTLAARLTEDPAVSVLVLEAGDANIDDPELLRPASYGKHFGNANYDWHHQTKKSKVTQREFSWSRGKGLGGSSAINFLVWSKPPVRDLNDIENLGNPGWNWENFQKYVARTEGFIAPSDDFQKKHNMNFDSWSIGKEGPLKITYPKTVDPGELKVQQTLFNAGLPAAPNPLSGDPKGAYFAPNTYDPTTHTRTYSTTAFYTPNASRPNFKVLTSAHVQKISTRETLNGNLTAVGVEFKVAGKSYVVNAGREVILAAGSLKTPQILELSGIGSKEVLHKIGVPVRLELPGVGENIQEHMICPVNFELRDDVSYETLCVLNDPDVAKKHTELHASGSGLFTTGLVGFAFASLDQISPRADEIVRNAKEHIAKNADSFPPGLLEQYKIQIERLGTGSPACEFINFPGLLMSPTPAEKGKRYLTMLSGMNHCFSRGSIHATSDDPAKDPEFDPQYLDQQVDLDVWSEMVKFARKLGRTAPMKDLIAREVTPGPDVDDSEVPEFVKAHFGTTWHTVGSCSMLPKEDNGVVDPQLKVYGTNNIRIVDLSVIPLHFAAHSQSVVYAVAEQAADIIKASPLL
ncbi:alcohol oxidase [Amylocystis lapponica]|nr:alcohol oxidase [Amylocystis lapponica]